MSSSDSDESEAEGAQARLPSFFRKHQPVRRREPTINLVSSESEDESRETSANRRPTSDKHNLFRTQYKALTNRLGSACLVEANDEEEAHEKWRTEAAATKERSMKLAQQEEEQREQKAAHRPTASSEEGSLKKTQPGLASAKERIRVRASPKRGELTNLAEISRPHGSVWKKKRNGKKAGAAGNIQMPERFVGDFFSSILAGRAERNACRSSHPDNADELCERTFFRIIHAVVMYDIPPSLIIGMDQTGVMQVWSGQTVKSLPDVDADGMDKAQNARIRFLFGCKCQENKSLQHFEDDEGGRSEFLVNSHSQQIDQGLTPEQAEGPSSAGLGRKCAVKEWNLSAECITSRRAKAAWREYLRKDETLRNEIEGKIGELGDLIAEEPDEEGETSTEEAYDDTDVSLRAVVQQALGVDVPEADQQGEPFCTGAFAAEVRAVDQTLQSSGDQEDVGLLTTQESFGEKQARSPLCRIDRDTPNVTSS
ncbi:uncharacterized protein B0H18DRAFT_954880 [Fomitopsis serialis]|uniref:uncharacterized protein n=1 Tax=Fomitopsis serialis TaxID=139415 RepID=UPI0020077E1C|nr:uncharacterized protein B0H18DRAFT_954880 [Neoantrodia serialis]KAH9925966.1 hypothetical protein B0H18DRAFT_954880 [Neoantrodia serialis]